MKKSAKVRFLRLIIVLTFITLLLSGFTAFADDTTDRGQLRARYITIGHKKLPKDVQGTGMSYGAGFKRGLFGMEVYQTNYNTMPSDMAKSSASFNALIGGSGTKTGEKVISDGGFGFDFNFFYPVVRRLELYGGPSMAFEKESDVYSGAVAVAGTTPKYADFPGTMKTRFSGQVGLMTYIPFGKHNMSLNVGYSAYRGITGGVGFGF